MSNRDISSHNAWASPNLRIQTGEDGSIDLQAGSLLKYTSLRLDADQTEDLLNWLQRREGRPAPTLQEPFIPLVEGDTSETTGYRIVPDNDGWHWRWVWIEPDEDDETSPPFASREDAYRGAAEDWDVNGLADGLKERILRAMEDGPSSDPVVG